MSVPVLGLVDEIIVTVVPHGFTVQSANISYIHTIYSVHLYLCVSFLFKVQENQFRFQTCSMQTHTSSYARSISCVVAL